jgi:ribosome-associated heat shock protein Hsp15
MAEDEETGRQRIDKWLWAARFFKTRSLAAVAVDGGRVKWNGQNVKPARELKPGEEIRRLAPMPGAGLKGRPTKKAGRQIRGFNE